FPRPEGLFAQNFEVRTLTLTGEPFRIADQVTVNSGVSLAALSAAGSTLAYGVGGSPRMQWTWFDSSGKTLDAVGEGESTVGGNPALSPDGTRLAVARNAGNWDIWWMDLSRPTWRRLTTDPALDFNPVWTPGGRVIFQSSRTTEGADLFVKSIDGGASEEV